jgi:hypothetical protein
MRLRFVSTMEATFRQLKANEMRLLAKLLDHGFPGRDALRVQLSSLGTAETDSIDSIMGGRSEVQIPLLWCNPQNAY